MEMRNTDKDEFLTSLFTLAENKNWDAVGKLISKRGLFNDVTQPNKNGFNKTILHYACIDGDTNVAKPAVEKIFEELSLLFPGYDELKDFVNAKESNGQTALDFALAKGHDDIVEILLQNNADVSIKFDSIINKRYHKVLSKFFDDGLSLTTDMYDTSNEYLWVIWCKFSALTGYSTNGNFRETKTLAKVLTIDQMKNYEIFSHLLVQIFVHGKCKKYKWLIGISFFVHMFWYLLTTTYFYSGFQTQNTGTSDVNTTERISNNSTDIPDWITSQNWFSFSVFPYMFLLMSIKEVGKIILTSTACKTVYFKQCENWGKVTLLVLVFTVGTFGSRSWANYMGLVVSFYLILMLFTKTDFFGLRLQIILKSFVLLMEYIVSFGPVLAIFMVIFSTVLLPNDINLVMRTIVGCANFFAMLVGEINFSDMFSEEKMKDKKNELDVLIMAVIYFVFILLALLLQNILIGQVVDNMEKIKRKATAAHVVARLQVVHSWESLLFGKASHKFLHSVGLKDSIVKKLSVGQHGQEIIGKPEGLAEEFSYKVEFLNLPEYIREAMYKCKAVFPDGVNPADHEDW